MPYPYVERSEAESRDFIIKNHTSITTSIWNKRMRILSIVILIKESNNSVEK